VRILTDRTVYACHDSLTHACPKVGIALRDQWHRATWGDRAADCVALCPLHGICHTSMDACDRNPLIDATPKAAEVLVSFQQALAARA